MAQRERADKPISTTCYKPITYPYRRRESLRKSPDVVIEINSIGWWVLIFGMSG
jgi:hypothetical protein